VPDQPVRITSSPYATDRLARAVARAAQRGDAEDRGRARVKARQWRDVVDGMASGRIHVGSRAPVAATPAWVTLEVVHGGFATGRGVAEAPLTADEAARLAELPEGAPGDTNRERLNLWYLSDAGQVELRDAVHSGRYRVDVPEEGAIAVVVLLLDKGFTEQALDLLLELHPFLRRLRFTPSFEPAVRLSGTAVRVAPVAEVAKSLRTVRMPPQVAVMRETLGVWHPLYDRLVALWSRTVEGELPHLDPTGGVCGGWPCRQWPTDWARERTQWLADYTEACGEHRLSGGHTHPKSNFTRLRAALLACPDNSGALTGREVGWIRRALANTVARHGAPSSAQREELRSAQTVTAVAATNSEFARVLAQRLDRYPADGGLPSLDPVAAVVSEQDTAARELLHGLAIPHRLVHKATRALEAPPDELIRLGVITSGETLAAVLPQLTSRLMGTDIDDPVVAGLYEQVYTAFRRRRSLLLLNLEHQVRFDELPWITALAPFRASARDNAVAVYRSLRQTTMLALTAFPYTALPNPLIAEFGALSTLAGISLPLVEELAADIFMGTFTAKWREAAAVTSRTMAGTLYANYYDLPGASGWAPQPTSTIRWRKKTAPDFARLCAERAMEAGDARNTVARNGAVLEQGQILTTHNLAVLVDGLDLTNQLRENAPELAWRTLDWVVGRLAQQTPDPHAALIQVKNAAYAWRQAIFLLSFAEPSVQTSQVHRLGELAAGAGIGARFAPAVDGLAHIIDGGRFTALGTVPGGHSRRFLGWAVGGHWWLR
jgi:hypothetical protein